MGRSLLIRLARRAAIAGAAVVLALTALPAQTANALLVLSGVCTFDVTITFTSPPTLLGASPGYRIDSNDANPSNGCFYNQLIPTEGVVAAGSAAAGEGGTSFSKCGVLAGIGTWNETFGPSIDEVFDGSHVIAGTWLGATMVVNSTPGGSALNFTGVFALLPHPDEPTANAAKLQTCLAGGTVTSIRMLAVEVFNDPKTGLAQLSLN